MSAGDAARTAARGIGQTLITVGVVLLLFVVYQLWVTGLVTERQQDALADELAQQWERPAPAVPDALPDAGPAVRPAAVDLGEGIAVLRIPSFDEDWARVVVEGTDQDALRKGPGRLVESALPGEVGNLVISGHRTTYGAPFADLGELEPGEAVVVETRDTWFTYRITGSEVVAPTAVEVTLPVPHQPGVEPTEQLLTLTTCHPKYSARQRLIVYAALEEELAKADGDPAALTGV